MTDPRDPRFDRGRPPGRVPAPPRRGAPGPPGVQPPRPGERPAAPGEVPLLTHHDGPPAGWERLPRRDDPDVPTERIRGPVAVAERPPAGTGPPLATAVKRRRRRRIRRILLTGLGVLLLGPVLAFAVGWLLFPVPGADSAVTQVANFTFADGVPLATVRPDNVNRVSVTLDRVPEHVRQAVLSAEDRSFYSNPGFDVTGIARAAWNQVTGGSGGGSTITQQYVKVTTGQDDFSLWRKYKEIVLAAKISREQTKDQILENYLNVIYLGRGAYGIQAASQAYFGKDAGELTVSEGAMLAGIIQSPSRWDPAKNPDRTLERWNFVLDGMVAQQWLAPQERAQAQFPTNWLPEPPPSGGIPGDDRGHIYNLANAELEQAGITEQQINTEGLTITTTVDSRRQKDLVDAVDETLRNQPENLRTAAVSIDPRSGAVLAYYGGANGVGLDYARTVHQPGSAFKPFAFSAALQGDDGVGLGTVYDGSSGQTFPDRTRPVNNSEGFSCGQCTVKTAMTQSINTVFYRMALDVGPAKVVDAAHQAGIPKDYLTQPAGGGIALGDQEVRPYDMASAFGTFAADGMRREPYVVAKVVAADGRVLLDRTAAAGEQAMPQQVARNVTESMIDVAASSGIGLPGSRPVAAKTGTVQRGDSGGANKDAWTVGYTPSMVTAVWVGTDANEPLKDRAGRNIFGRSVPGKIWQRYMTDALRGTPVEQFSRLVPLGDPPVVDRPADDDEEHSEENGEDRGDHGDDGRGDGGEDGSDPGDSGDRGNGGDDGESGDDDAEAFAPGDPGTTFPFTGGQPPGTGARPPSSG